MSSRIAVGVDGTDAARNALHWAADWAVESAADLAIVHVRPDTKSDEDVAANELHWCRERFAGLDVTSLNLTGHAMDRLAALSSGYDLVVIGTHKTGFIHGKVFGSRGLRLVAASHAPVAVIPPDSGHRSRGVIVGIDDSGASVDAVHWAAAAADRRGYALTVLNAEPLTDADVIERLLAHTRKRFPDLELQLRTVRRPAAEALVDAGSAAMLLVIGRLANSKSDIPLGPIAHDVLLNISCPTVVVPR